MNYTTSYTSPMNMQATAVLSAITSPSFWVPGTLIQAPPFVGPAVGLCIGIVRADDGRFPQARERTIHLTDPQGLS